MADYQARIRLTAEDKTDTRQRLPGMSLGWCYRITPSLFELDV